MNNTKLHFSIAANSVYASELCRPTANHKFTRTQVNLTRAWALVGPGVDTPLHQGQFQGQLVYVNGSAGHLYQYL